jgi:hypothetical protein
MGLQKIADAGHPSERWNLVLVSDGYTATQLPRFASDALALRDYILSEPPFDRQAIRDAINIYRLDVRSTESGADKPRCKDGAGTGHESRTYFDSKFCSDGKTQRLLYGDAQLVVDAVKQLLPEWHQIMVLVNDSERGGAGGTVAWFSNGAPDWREVALHELGHSAFGLADEYDYGGVDRWPGGEPGEPNVSSMSDVSRVKWNALANTKGDPTRTNPDCSKTDPGPSPMPPSAVGTFEGARYAHCGLYRPVWDCMMRNTSAPFCPVCTEVIVRVMAPFAPRARHGISLARRIAGFMATIR